MIMGFPPVEEINRMLERVEKYYAKDQKCVSCGNPSKGDFCEFCLNEE